MRQHTAPIATLSVVEPVPQIEATPATAVEVIEAFPALPELFAQVDAIMDQPIYAEMRKYHLIQNSNVSASQKRTLSLLS